jgi:hypothetical protein
MGAAGQARCARARGNLDVFDDEIVRRRAANANDLPATSNDRPLLVPIE